MITKIKNRLKKIPRYTWILSAIILIGIFLRAYNFHDWLRFNADQSRDAEVISSVLEGKIPLPLLGPKAGGTEFRLGAIFYDFQFLSAKTFGNYPDKMAYPDLFFSILSILLFFLFFRKLFKDNLALSLTALYSFSFFAIKYSRFAWNPNSTPFWTMLFLYALSEVIDRDEKSAKGGSAWDRKKIFWSIISGLALGISIQLHTLLLIAFPILSVLLLIYFSTTIKKTGLWKNAVIILIFALILNIPQIASEIKTKGENTRYFFNAITLKNGNNKNKSLFDNIKKDFVCHINGNIHILSSLGSAEECQLYNSKDSALYKISFSLFGIIFFLGGFVLMLYRLKRNVHFRDKIFLKIISAYLIISFLLFIPLINEITIRYFLVIIFMPFLFLGFWLEFLMEKTKIQKNSLFIAIIVIILISINIFTLQKNFIEWSNYAKTTAVNFENTTLKEVESMASFIASNSKGSDAVFLDGKNLYLFKFQKSIEYFTERSGIKINSSKKYLVGDTVFQLVPTRGASAAIEKKTGKFDMISQASFGRFTLIKFIKKLE